MNKPDPISERAKALRTDISSIQNQIRKLEAEQSKPKAVSSGSIQAGATFEDLKPANLANLDLASAPELEQGHYNELGVRKYDILSAWERLKNQFRTPAASNPKLVSYLAAGTVRGLRPLRYEKRVARNRFIALFLILIAILWGLVVALFKNV